jgi:hypothetical protein
MAFHDLAKVTTPTTGTGTITLGAAVNGFLTFAQTGVIDQETVSYGIFDPVSLASEAGHGVYSASGTTLSRTPVASTNGGAAINLSGSAIVVLTLLAEDIAVPQNLVTKIANYTASNNDLVEANTADGVFNVLLPANPLPKWQVTVHDYNGTFNANNLSVLGNGAPINGVVGTYICDLNNETRVFTYVDAFIGWSVA